MGKPLKAIPQVIVEDRKAGQVLDALKYVIDVREGRGTADRGKMWVTFDDLWDAIKKIDFPDTPVQAGSLFYDEYEASEALEAGVFVHVFKDVAGNNKLKVKKACSLIDDTHSFVICNGYVKESCAAGASAVVYYNGINEVYSDFASLNAGDIVYLSTTAGMCSGDRSTIYQMVGMVVKSGILFLAGDKSVDLKDILVSVLFDAADLASSEEGSIVDLIKDIKDCACGGAGV